MIVYQLVCDEDHSFEAWFRDSKAFDAQAKRGHVECPFCGSTKVAKAPMAPAIRSSKSADAPRSENPPAGEDAPDVSQQILDAVNKIRDYAEANFENVGEDFAKEARKIHAGEAEERGIYGRATEDEARELEDEGVEFVRLPGAPRRNS